jgi:hypothetical protein
MYRPVLAGGGLGGGVDSTTALICACWVFCCHWATLLWLLTAAVLLGGIRIPI